MLNHLTEAPVSFLDFFTKLAAAKSAMGVTPDEIQVNPNEPVFIHTPSGTTVFSSTFNKNITVTKDTFVPVGICWFYHQRLLGTTSGFDVSHSGGTDDYHFSAPKACTHEWDTYEGLMTTFDYCKHCDVKRS